jgi:hypothetical protein
MPITPVPDRGGIVYDAMGRQLVAEPAWREWFLGVFKALFGFKRSFTGSANLDFGLIGAGSEASLTITVAGARTGDAVIVTPASKTSGVIDNVGIVTANDTVTVYAHNITGAGIDPAEKAYRVICLQQ